MVSRLALSLTLLATGCVYSGELLYRDAGSAPVVPMAWGTHAATLAVADCAALSDGRAPLVVDSTGDFLLDGGASLTDPGGQPLSLRQAMTIAANRPGLDVILFEPTRFPPEAPATISLVSFSLPLQVGPMCIDARNRGVVIEFDEGSNFWPLEPGSLQVGLTFLNAAQRQFVRGAQVAGCRFGTDGLAEYRPQSSWNVQVTGDSIIGPGNVFVGNTGVRVFGGPKTVITENTFGYDPLTGVTLPMSSGIDLTTDAQPLELIVRRNVFSVSFAAYRAPIPGGFADLSLGSSGTFIENWVGVTPDGGALLGGRDGLGRLSVGRLVVGPGNVIRHAAVAATIEGTAEVVLTRNSISQNDAGIVFPSGAAVPAPVIDSVTAAAVTGTCAVPGEIEVFSDLGTQSEVFLQATPCDATSPWSVTTTIQGGHHVSATLSELNPDGTPRRTSAFSATVTAP